MGEIPGTRDKVLGVSDGALFTENSNTGGLLANVSRVVLGVAVTLAWSGSSTNHPAAQWVIPGKQD